MAVETERLFFALWPDENTRQALCRWRAGKLPGRGRWVARENLHITLLFLGGVDLETRHCLCEHVDTLQAEGFSLTLSEAGIWKKPQVAWLGAARPSGEQLGRLVKQLHEISGKCGLQLPLRGYVPHVTMARKVSRLPQEWREKSPDIEWQAREFVLVRSVPEPNGVMYEPIKSWKLKTACQ